MGDPVVKATTYECGHLNDFYNSRLVNGKWSCEKCIIDAKKARS